MSQNAFPWQSLPLPGSTLQLLLLRIQHDIATLVPLPATPDTERIGHNCCCYDSPLLIFVTFIKVLVKSKREFSTVLYYFLYIHRSSRTNRTPHLSQKRTS